MTKAELVSKIAGKANITKASAERALNALLESAREALVKQDKVTLTGFGTFGVEQRKERKGRNPRTKEEITIPATTAPAFKAGKALKDAL